MGLGFSFLGFGQVGFVGWSLSVVFWVVEVNLLARLLGDFVLFSWLLCWFLIG